MEKNRVSREEGERGKGEAESRKSSRKGRAEENWEEENKEFERWRKRKSVIWRGSEGRNEEEREEKLRKIVKRVLRKERRIIRVRERRGEKI